MDFRCIPVTPLSGHIVEPAEADEELELDELDASELLDVELELDEQGQGHCQ
jgi:hypothetical protein